MKGAANKDGLLRLCTFESIVGTEVPMVPTVSVSQPSLERKLSKVVRVAPVFGSEELNMNKSIVVSLAILTLSTSVALAAQRTHHSRAAKPHASTAAMNPNAGPTNTNTFGGGPNAFGGGGPNAFGGRPNAFGGGPNTFGGGPNAFGGGPNAFGGGGQNAFRGGGTGPSPFASPVGASSGDRDLYIRNQRDSGWDRKKDFNPNGTIRTQ
jgi:hypothetical protein